MVFSFPVRTEVDWKVYISAVRLVSSGVLAIHAPVAQEISSFPTHKKHYTGTLHLGSAPSQ